VKRLFGMSYNPLEYWNKRGVSYRRQILRRILLSTKDRSYFRSGAKALEDTLRRIRAKTVLELGCGYGRNFAAYEKLGIEYVGVDFSRSMLNHAIRGRGRLVLGEVGRFLPIRSSFDATVATEVLLHVPPSTIKAAIQSICNLTRISCIIIDLRPGIRDPLEAHNFCHDLPALFDEQGFELAEERNLAGRPHAAFFVFSPRPDAHPD